MPHYKVWIKGKVEQSRERSSGSPSTMVTNFTYCYKNYNCMETNDYYIIVTLYCINY